MQNLSNTYPKNEKLKSRTAIAMLFDSGKSVTKYPLRLVYAPADNNADVPLQMGVSVSKKYFKRAHDRNYYKRVLRETYRLNQHILKNSLGKPYAFMFFYQTKDRLTFEEINEKTIALFEKFARQEKL
ncbi:MAG: ribonuclease P protein component [Flavobacterium sp.]